MRQSQSRQSGQAREICVLEETRPLRNETSHDQQAQEGLVSFVFTVTQTSMPLLAAQLAFKVLMIHRHLQFTLLITFRCVLHRCMSQEIRR